MLKFDVVLLLLHWNDMHFLQNSLNVDTSFDLFLLFLLLLLLLSARSSAWFLVIRQERIRCIENWEKQTRAHEKFKYNKRKISNKNLKKIQPKALKLISVDHVVHAILFIPRDSQLSIAKLCRIFICTANCDLAEELKKRERERESEQEWRSNKPRASTVYSQKNRLNLFGIVRFKPNSLCKFYFLFLFFIFFLISSPRFERIKLRWSDSLVILQSI